MRIIISIFLLLFITCLPIDSSTQCVLTVRPVIDLAFCLDTTGSMEGLIETAKTKIWLIMNVVARVKPAPVLRIGFIVYRDIGDDYVTQTHDFTSDVEGMYSQLRNFRATGGGDEPEHVSKALHDAVQGLSWSKQEGALKILFLVGDAPPHTEYKDGFDYRTAAKDAFANGIFVNTIQCGADPNTTNVWIEIASRAGGIFVKVDQDGGSNFVSSPYDAALVQLSDEISGTYVHYGKSGRSDQLAQLKHDADALRDLSGAADRAEAKSGELYHNEKWDLVDALQAKSVKIQDISQENLPPEIRGLTVAQIEEYIQEKAKFRSDLKEQVKKISQKRQNYLDEVASKLDTTNSFDQQVLKALRAQGQKKGICFE